ncbi:MAG: hypothetical protein JW866_06505 [Ignavibacteriales bacterium]|nr:hypothetical protein [Ignavibacteriales bacterium]
MKYFYFLLILLSFILSTSCNEKTEKKITEDEFKEHIYSGFSEYDSNDINIVRYMINEEKHYIVYPEYVFEDVMKLKLYKVTDEIVLLNTFIFEEFQCNKLLSVSLRDVAGDEEMELLVEPWNDSGQSYSRIDLIIFRSPITKDVKKIFELTIVEFSSGINENAEPESDIVHDLGIEYKVINGKTSIVATGTYNGIENQEIIYSWSDDDEKFIKTN